MEVRTDNPDAPELLAYFGRSRDNDFDMLAVILDESEPELDWFDNRMHDAHRDVTVPLFENSEMKTDWGRRETFKEQVLSYPGIRAEIGRLLDRG